MFYFVDYFVAKLRLKNFDQYITTLKQSGVDAPVNMLAQRDFIEMEIEFFLEQMKKELFMWLFGILFCVTIYFIFY